MKIKKITNKLNLEVKGQIWNASCLTDCSGYVYSGNRSSAENCDSHYWQNGDTTNEW